MDEAQKKQILAMSHIAHDWTETSYQHNLATRGDPAWAEKQRLLLADMALHLLQTSLKDGPLASEALKRNLFSILTISDQFLDGYGLKQFADTLYVPKADHPHDS